MAAFFFCPGSSVKLKEDSHRRPHPNDRHGYNHSPYPPYYPNAASNWAPPPGRTGSVTDRVQDVSAPQLPISDQFLQKLIVLQDHCPSKDSELQVRRGEKVEVVRREEEWLYIRNERGKEGYVPSKNCAPPVASSSRRTRSNSRPSMTHQIPENPKGTVPIYSSNSAGRLRRYDSPGSETEQGKLSIQRVSSPPSNILSPINNGYSDNKPSEGSSTILEPKHSPSSSSGVASLIDPYSPALVRAYSQDNLNPRTDTSYSLSQSAIDPSLPSSMSTFETSLVELTRRGLHRKQSSSDDSGTMDNMSRVKDNASTIRNAETSSEEGSLQQGRGSSASGRGTTPSMRDRPLPSPPQVSQKCSDEDTPPPIPPRHASLERSNPGLKPTPDDLAPYSHPVDSLISDTNGPRGFSMHQSRVKSLVEIDNKDNGINSPYSEVYRGQSKGSNRRPVNLPEAQNPGQFSRHRSPHSIISSQGRASSQVNGISLNEFTQNGISEHEEGGSRGVVKFRRCLWGVYICIKDFEGVDENEVSVRSGEHVLVFNQEDHDWYWIVKHKTDNSEGFVPSTILREVSATDTKNTAVLESLHNPAPLRQTKSPPTVSHNSIHRGRGLTNQPPPVSHRPPSTSYRSRVHSTGSSPIQKTFLSSTEKMSLRDVPLSPSSPPPPYAEQDPIHYRQQYDMTRANSHSIPRNHRLALSSRSGRVSAPHTPIYPPSPVQPGPGISHMTRSSSHLAAQIDPTGYRDHIGRSPITVTGGTLV